MEPQKQNTQLTTKKNFPESTLIRQLQTSGLTKLAEALPCEVGMTLFQIQANTTMQTALEAPKVNQLAKSLGNETVHKILIAVLKSFCDTMNVKESMNTMQIIHCSYAYMETFPNNSVKDLILCLKKAQKGDFGPVYNRLDQQVIFEFVRKHEEEKAGYLEEQHLNFKAQEASNVNGILENLPEETKEAIKNFTDPTKTPTAKPKSSVISESEYRMNLIAVLPEYSLQELHEARLFFMGRAASEYIQLVEKEIAKRPKTA